MRILVYLLSLLMVFAPTYSAYASGITKGQIIQMGKKGAALVRTGAGVAVKVGKVSRALTPVGSIVWCVSNKKCKDKIDDAYEIACDISGVCTVERKENDIPDEYCMLYSSQGSGYRYDLNEVAQFGMSKLQQKYPTKELVLSARSLSAMQKYTQQIFDKKELVSNQYYIVQVMEKNGNLYQDSSNDLYIYYTIQKNDTCDPGNARADSEENRKKLLNEVAKKIAENMDDDDIKNYYNTKYDDIIINNNHYYGDEINKETNIDKYCESNACHEISKEIEKDINEKKYDIDDVNEKNCTIEESTGKYIACSITINNEEENETQPDDTEQTTDKKEDDDPLSCDSSRFHRKICDWMDWTQDDLDAQDDGKAVIKDLSKDLEIDDDKIKFGRACPSGPIVNISFAGVSVSHDISYEGLCGAFEKMRSFVIGIGGIVSVMIIGGRRA